MALPEVFTYASSPSSIRLIDVPKKIGKWQITSVSVKAVYPDGSQTQAICVLVSGVWVCTLAGSSAIGKSKGGITVYASGVDENGGSVSGYVLGKGDMTILADDGELHPDVPSYVVKLFDEQPEEPSNGNVCKVGEDYMIWQNGEANALGVTHTELSSYYTKAEVDSQISSKADLNTLSSYYTKAEVDSQISSKADKTKSVKEYYPVLSDSWTGAGYTFRYAGKYMTTDVEQWLPTTYSPEGWSLRFISEEYGWVLAGPMSTQLTGIGIDATTLRFKNSEYDYTFTRNMTNYTEELYDVVYADTVEQMYTKAEVDAIIQKLKDDNHLV